MPGTLFVVGTPIGNLEDITLRAMRTLREVDVIAAEDTRRTSKLLAHYDIRRPLISIREHNEVRESPKVIARLQAGESVALVSDAGTPGISDPGAKLVRAVRETGLRVVPVPGPSAITAALSIAGVSADRFAFKGFPPSSGEARYAWIEDLTAEVGTVVFFESPHRILRTLNELEAHRPTDQYLVFRELSKIHEDLVVGPNTSHSVRPQGEFVVVRGPVEGPEPSQTVDTEVMDIVRRLTELAKFSEEQALEIAAAYSRVHVRVIRKTLKKSKISAKRQSVGPS